MRAGHISNINLLVLIFPVMKQNEDSQTVLQTRLSIFTKRQFTSSGCRDIKTKPILAQCSIVIPLKEFRKSFDYKSDSRQ